MTNTLLGMLGYKEIVTLTKLKVSVSELKIEVKDQNMQNKPFLLQHT